MTFSAQQKREAITREIGFRRRVYERRVAEGKMTKAKADHEIGVFEQIEADYAKLEESDRLL